LPRAVGQLIETGQLAGELFQRDQARHVVVVDRQADHFEPLATVVGDDIQGNHGQHGEAIDAHAEPLADGVQLALQIVRRHAADVQGFGQGAQEDAQALEVVRHGCHLPAGFFSPAGTAKGSQFAGGGSGQVANGVKAQGGLKARLKSSVILPSTAGLAFRKRPAP